MLKVDMDKIYCHYSQQLNLEFCIEQIFFLYLLPVNMRQHISYTLLHLTSQIFSGAEVMKIVFLKQSIITNYPSIVF